MWGELPKGVILQGYPFRPTRGNVAALCALFRSVLLVDDAEERIGELEADRVYLEEMLEERGGR